MVDEDVVAFGRFVSFFRSQLPLQAELTFKVIALDPSIEERQRLYQIQPRLLSQEDPEAENFLADVGVRLGLWKDVRFAKVSGVSRLWSTRNPVHTISRMLGMAFKVYCR